MKRIVICLDGTWNSPNENKRRDNGAIVAKPSNVLKVARSVVPRDENGVLQVCYYDLGVGGLNRWDGVSNKLLHAADRALGGVFGAGFEANLEDAVRFLIHNHEPQDHIYLFGFSRGAATARAVANFLDWLGGLPTRDDEYWLAGLLRGYVRGQGQVNVESVTADLLKRSRGRDQAAPEIGEFQPIAIQFLGVWDTVLALGGRLRTPRDRTTHARRAFHVQDRPPAIVRTARQALAIDEKRSDFRPEIWLDRGQPQQDMEQMWFAGVHSNIGGGYPNDGLANNAFRWMADEAAHGGLAFSATKLHRWRGYPQDEIHDSYSRAFRWADRLRWRRKLGRRSLDLPASAKAAIHSSVITTPAIVTSI